MRDDHEPPSELIYGVHPVSELLQSRADQVDRIYVARDGGAGLGRLLRAARDAGVPVSHLTREDLGRRLGRRAGHQGVAARVAPVRYADAERICRDAAALAEGTLVLVDRVTDAGNLGAILRTAAGAGAAGVLLSTEGTAGLTPHAAKAAAGALERLPVAREPKPARRIERLAAAGFVSVALDPRGERTWDEIDLRGRLVVLAGGEARGPRPAVAGACAYRVSIPLAPGIESLNVAVSTGVLLFEALRQRRLAMRGERDG